jgi:hypothetical protein
LPTLIPFALRISRRFYEALGGGRRDAGLDGSLRSVARLGIVPGATHYNILSTPMVAEMVLPFLSSAT